MRRRITPLRAVTRVPEGVVQSGGDWAYAEFTGEAGVSALGMDAKGDNGKSSAMPAVEEKRRILDLFRQ